MDPRHPELAIARMRELMKQYDHVESDMKGATTSAQLAELEREGSLVVQEICLVAPRIHEAMMQTSRQRRHDLSRGVLIEPQDTAVELPVEKRRSEALAEIAKQTEKISEQVSEIVDIVTEKVKKTVEKSAQSVTEQPTEPTQSVEKTEAKPEKKTTRKKTAKKKAKK